MWNKASLFYSSLELDHLFTQNDPKMINCVDLSTPWRADWIIFSLSQTGEVFKPALLMDNQLVSELGHQ